MELRFEAMLYSKLGDENSDVGHIKCSCGRRSPTPALDLGTGLGDINKTALEQWRQETNALQKFSMKIQVSDTSRGL